MRFKAGRLDLLSNWATRAQRLPCNALLRPPFSLLRTLAEFQQRCSYLALREELHAAFGSCASSLAAV
jgi:hypothetical protein